jgi:hypothetical protein
MTIVASQIVNVVPSVLSSGGTPTSTQGLFLTSGARVPTGQVLSFPTATAVGLYFGLSSTEYAAALIYFAGFTGAQTTPAGMLFAQYPTGNVAAWLRGASLASMTLTALKLLSGTLSLTVNGTLYTSSSISLTSATSFSNAATIIQAAFTTPNFTVSFDSTASAFIFTSNTTGTASTITVAGGTLASALGLTAAAGAVTSQGANAATPSAFMTALLLQTSNWASFTTLFDPDSGSGNTQKLAFATWNGQQNNEYLYIAWDTDVTPTLSSTASGSLGALLTAQSISGTMAIYSPDYTLAVFACAIGASVDFTQVNGRITYAFKSQSGLVPSVTDPTVAANLISNGYNFYGAYALASNNWQFLNPGTISGQYRWADAYLNQIWLNNALQLALMTLLTTARSVPYNAAGYAMIEAACNDPIAAAVNFGAIRTGVNPSALEIAEMNQTAGIKIDQVMATRGWYLRIGQATALVRGNRGSPPIVFFYMDGGSVQMITLSSVEVQ